jgi:hypothetical protein
MSNHTTPAAATDIGEFITDLDAGTFERLFSVALSQVAAAVTDTNKTGEVTVKFTIKKVAGTSQVNVAHQLKLLRPTANGKATEENKRDTVLHVGKNGRMSLVPESQLQMFEKTRGINA